MEDLKTKAQNLTDSLKEYFQTYYKVALLNVSDKATSIAASTVASVAIAFLGIFVLFFGGIALAVWLGSVTGSSALGFLLVAGLFLLIIIIMVSLRKTIVFPIIRNSIINKLYEPTDQDIS